MMNVFPLVPRIEAIRLSSHASFKDFCGVPMEVRVLLYEREKGDQDLLIRREKGDIAGLQVKQKEDGIFISQDKYVTEILKNFSFTDVKIASTPMETQKPLLKDEYGEECVPVQDTKSTQSSHLYAVKRIFRDSNEKKLIQMIKIHTDKNVPDLTYKSILNNGIAANAGDSKLMLLGINLLLLGKVNAARHKLTAVGES
ncbi:hypothetical protein Tco_0671157 [Tanacetum coccineum]